MLLLVGLESSAYAKAKPPRKLSRAEVECVATLANVTCGKAFTCGAASPGVTFPACIRTVSRAAKKDLRPRTARQGKKLCNEAVVKVSALTCNQIKPGGGGTGGGKK